MDWAWITAKVITATGWTFDTLYEQPACDVMALLEYWAEEPPVHVTLALRYFGPGKRGQKKISEEQARNEMAAMSQMMGQGARPLPPHLRQMVERAEQLKREHRGM